MSGILNTSERRTILQTNVRKVMPESGWDDTVGIRSQKRFEGKIQMSSNERRTTLST